ncbi:GumC family protein [Compostibacter hankyongensis]|uniref:non-specific protein-tyrosine kinase n=1 Tax=Compostibacter hankyongensis TaxID=1007089 RepID=A0ABP8GBG5_9BACT
MEQSEQLALQEENTVNLREIIVRYLRHWYWFAIGIVIMLFLAFLYLHIATPIYQVESALLIKQENGQGGQNLENDILNQLNMMGGNANVDNEMAILQSHYLNEQVVRKLDLSTTYYVRDGLRHKELYRSSPVNIVVLQKTDSTQKITFKVQLQKNGTYRVTDDDGEAIVNNKQVAHLSSGHFLILPINRGKETDSLARLGITVVITPLQAVVENYQKSLGVTTTSKTSSVLNLTLKTPVQQKGKDYLTTLIDAYNNAGLQDKNLTAENTVRFVDGRVDSLSGELNTIESRLEEFMQSHSMADLDAQSQLFLDQVKDVDNQLSVQQLRLNVLQSIREYVSNPGQADKMVPSSLGIDDPTLLSLINNYNNLELERGRNIQAGAKSDNPLVKGIDTQLTGLRSDILQSVKNLEQATQLALNKLNQQNQYFENQIRSVPALQRNYISIKRQQEIKQNLYLYLLQKREEAAISQAAAVSGSRLIDPANSSPKPISPKSRLIYLAAFLIGLCVPVGMLYAKDLLNNKIHSRKEVEEHTHAPILGEIAHSTEGDNIVVKPGARSVIAEQFRTLRTNLTFMTGTDDSVKTLLITSSTSGEGKSFISLNLAAGYALADKRVAILGLDLRNPKLARVLGAEHHKGISNYLAGQASLEELPMELPFGNHKLFFVPSGPIPPNPAELILNERMDKLIDHLKSNFDIVLLDTPPIGLVTDAQLLTKYVDVCLFIVRHNYTLKGQVQIIAQLYQQKKFPNLTIVLNDIKSGDAYRYQYGYGYGYGYYSDDAKRGRWKRRFQSR